jgi:shikimate dehydrogenase
MTQKLGILGENISYSLSPLIHNFSAKLLSLDFQYNIYDIKKDDLPQFLQHFESDHGVGLNITTPYKEERTNLVNTNLQAINTLFLKQGSWTGLSTDAQGFFNGIKHINLNIESFDKIVIIGHGGVVRSLIEGIDSLKLRSKVSVYCRNPNKQSLIKSSQPKPSVNQLTTENIKTMVETSSTKTIVIQATSAPLRGDDLSWLVESFQGYQGTFVDLVYKTPSQIYHHLKKIGNPCQDGLPMLIEQARLSQKIWWGESAPYEKILNAIS